MPKEIKYKVCSGSARVPLHATSHSAGYDLYLTLNKKISPFKSELIKTDLQIKIREGFYRKIIGRSGVASKHNIITHVGTIDSDFCGCDCVILVNISRIEYEINYGERIVQIILKSMKR